MRCLRVPHSYFSMRFKILKLIIFLSILGSCFHSPKPAQSSVPDVVFVQEFPDKNDIVQGLQVVIEELDKRGIYTTEQMIEALHGQNMKSHDKCKASKHKMRILFTSGSERSENKKKLCIYADSKHLKGKCLIGLFNGSHTLYVKTKGKKLYNTAFAHEVFHYFQKYVGGMAPKKHVPRDTWKKLFGYKDKALGEINEVLKEKGL